MCDEYASDIQQAGDHGTSGRKKKKTEKSVKKIHLTFITAEKRLTNEYGDNRQKQAVIRVEITACFAYYVQIELYTSYVLNKKQTVVIL